MRMSYTSSSGEEFDLSGFRPGSGLSGNGFRGWELTRDGRAFVRGSSTMDATMSFVGRSGEDRERAVRMFELCDADAQALTPGRLRFGDWYLECYVIAGDCDSMAAWGVSYSVKLVADIPLWRRETAIEFMPNSSTGRGKMSLDYPHDHPHDYGASQQRSSRLTVPGVTPADFRLTVYGPAASPYVRIAGNTYQVDVAVPSGGLLTVDSTKRRSMRGDAVVLSDRYGGKTDVFSKRLKGHEGSGTYLFERLPPGEHDVSWPQSFGFTLTVIEGRGRLPWTSY